MIQSPRIFNTLLILPFPQRATTEKNELALE